MGSDEELSEAAAEVAARVAADPRYGAVTDLLVERSGRALLQWRRGRVEPHDLFSVTKTVLALLTGIAVGDGLLAPQDPVERCLPTGRRRPELAGQTLDHLLTMTRGAETGGRFDLDEAAVSGGSWAAVFAGAPSVAAPGAEFRYDNGASMLLAEVLHRVTGDLAEYAGRRLLDPLGITAWSWRRDPSGTPVGPGHLSMAAPDLARVGRLLCDDGSRDGAVLVDPAWVRGMRTPSSAGGPPEDRSYGRGLWIEDAQVCFGAGWAGQLLLCRPRDGLVVVAQSDPGFDYGPPARDALAADWRAPLGLVREVLLSATRR